MRESCCEEAPVYDKSPRRGTRSFRHQHSSEVYYDAVTSVNVFSSLPQMCEANQTKEFTNYIISSSTQGSVDALRR